MDFLCTEQRKKLFNCNIYKDQKVVFVVKVVFSRCVQHLLEEAQFAFQLLTGHVYRFQAMRIFQLMS